MSLQVFAQLSPLKRNEVRYDLIQERNILLLVKILFLDQVV